MGKMEDGKTIEILEGRESKNFRTQVRSKTGNNFFRAKSSGGTLGKLSKLGRKASVEKVHEKVTRQKDKLKGISIWRKWARIGIWERKYKKGGRGGGEMPGMIFYRRGNLGRKKVSKKGDPVNENQSTSILLLLKKK